MTKYLVKTTSITYKKIEAESREQAEEFALCEPVNEFEEYVEVEEDEEDWVWLTSFQWHVTLGVKDTQVH